MGYLEENQEFNLYKDISQRTGGEIYIGVVGPVRTGKSTFIKRFMDIMVIPKIENEHDRTRAMDERSTEQRWENHYNDRAEIYTQRSC